MASFEINRNSNIEAAAQSAQKNLDPKRLREECIIALKVYDSCRQQDCLGEKELGPARASDCCCLCDRNYCEGDVIDPPNNAAAVTIDKLKVKKVIIVEKEPSVFRNGYWDVDLKYVFEYRLVFREADGCVIGSVRANSIYNKRVTMFGSTGSDIVYSTDLFSTTTGDSTTLDSDPFVLCEAKGVALTSELKYCRPRNCGDSCHPSTPEPNSVSVTIGLFTIIKLFRIVQLSVESKGFCIPCECEEVSPLNPCEFFDSLDFPMDIFSPPTKTRIFCRYKWKHSSRYALPPS